MSFEFLPDEVLPAVFSNVTPGALLKLSLVSDYRHIQQLGKAKLLI